MREKSIRIEELRHKTERTDTYIARIKAKNDKDKERLLNLLNKPTAPQETPQEQPSENINQQ